MNLKNFLIKQSQTITEAFSLIDKNTHGAVFVVNENEEVVGMATDGDIRRWLISKPDMDAKIVNCMNKNFVHTNVQTPRERILKMLDHKIHLIPVLNSNGQLVDIITRSLFPLRADRRIFARAKAPVRVSFGGGGTDLTQFFMKNGGVVMNASIAKFSHALLKKREDESISIYSHDLKLQIEAADLSALLQRTHEMPLIISLLKLLKPNYGFDLQIGSDFPMSSGLGGSAVVLTAIIGCFNQFREDRWDNYEIAEMAFQAERLVLEVPGGWQDQYATVFGGFNFMEFSEDSNVVHPLRVGADLLCELEENLVLCYTGKPHPTGVHKDQKEEMQKEEILKLIEKNKLLTYKMKNYLLKGQLFDFGRCLHEGWMMKKQFSKKISDAELDKIYDVAMSNGACGGKILGAGGGGYFLFFAKPMQRYTLETALGSMGYKTERITFDHHGLQSWTVKENEMIESGEGK